MQPAWLVDLLAVVMLATAAVCAGRLVVSRATGRSTHRDVELAHVTMGVAMAGMLLPSFRTLPTGAWEVVFGAMTVWFAAEVWRFGRRCGWRDWDADQCHHVSHFATHLVMAVAMLTMFVSGPAGATMTAGTAAGSMGASASGTSGLALLLVLLLMVAAVWYADSLPRFSREVATTPAAVVAAPAASGVPQGRAGALLALPGARRVVRGAPVMSACDDLWLAPRMQVALHMTMCVVMAYMLVVMQ